MNNEIFLYYVLDDFGEIIRYFYDKETAYTFIRNKKRIHKIDYLTELGDCLF